MNMPSKRRNERARTGEVTCNARRLMSEPEERGGNNCETRGFFLANLFRGRKEEVRKGGAKFTPEEEKELAYKDFHRIVGK